MIDPEFDKEGFEEFKLNLINCYNEHIDTLKGRMLSDEDSTILNDLKNQRSQLDLSTLEQCNSMQHINGRLLTIVYRY